MADTKIPYVDEVWNPVVGCTKCSPGCLNCYAEKMAQRLYWMGMARPATLPEYMSFENGWNGHIELCEYRLDKPIHWRDSRKILCCSMGDIFHEKVPFEFIDKVYGIAAICQQHQLFFLTKRIENAARYLIKRDEEDDLRETQIDSAIAKMGIDFHGEVGNDIDWPLPNVHLGVTVCNQEEADRTIPILVQIPAAHRWVSFEPLLEGIDARRHLLGKCGYYCDERVGHVDHTYIDFAVIGCESGPKRRPCKKEWIKSLYDQCKAAGVDVMVKQMAENKDGTGKVCHDPAECERRLR